MSTPARQTFTKLCPHEPCGLPALFCRTGSSAGKAEIAARGLVLTVTQAYYGLVVAQRKYANEQRAASEAARFLDISQKLEKGGEVAHADVLKASIQAQQQQRDLQEAQIAMERSRLDLAVMLFPDFNQNFTVVDDLQNPEPLPTFTEVAAAGQKNNPDLRAALAAYEVDTARGDGRMGRSAAVAEPGLLLRN